MYRKVTFYTTADGKCPVAEFIDSQTPKVAQKIAWVLKAVQEIEKVPKTYFKKLSDTDFYEVRIEWKYLSIAGILSQRNYCNSYRWFPKEDSENTKV